MINFTSIEHQLIRHREASFKWPPKEERTQVFHAWRKSFTGSGWSFEYYSELPNGEYTPCESPPVTGTFVRIVRY